MGTKGIGPMSPISEHRRCDMEIIEVASSSVPSGGEVVDESHENGRRQSGKHFFLSVLALWMLMFPTVSRPLFCVAHRPVIDSLPANDLGRMNIRCFFFAMLSIGLMNVYGLQASLHWHSECVVVMVK